MAVRKRNIQIKFYVTDEEKQLIDKKLTQLPVKRIGAYLRKMAIDGYIINLDTADIKAFTSELSAISVTSPFWRTAVPKRKGRTRKGVKKTCQWHVFSPWESPFPFRYGNQIPLPPDVNGIDFLRQFDYNTIS